MVHNTFRDALRRQLPGADNSHKLLVTDQLYTAWNMDEGDPIQSKVPRLDDNLSRGEFKSDTVRLLSSIHHVVDPKENFGIINHLLNTF